MSKNPEPRYITPTLESITVKSKYWIPLTDFGDVLVYLKNELTAWRMLNRVGDSVELVYISLDPPEEKAFGDAWSKRVKQLRAGVPIDFYVTAIERSTDGMIVEVQCLPTMWHSIARFGETTFTENQVQEALLECKLFVRQTMSGLKGKEIEPVSVYPIIQRTEVKSRLLNLGLQEIVDKLDKAEEHIVQNDFSESLKSSRTAFEKMIDWQMVKRGLEKTDNYKNDLERLKSKGHLDPDTTQLLQSYYRCLSSIGVHEKGVPPGIYEAQMGYGITLIMLGYFADKLP
jgi:hypothetical protein